MGVQESYLSKREGGIKEYNVDMVTAISDQALNSQIRYYLSSSKCKWETKVFFLKTLDDEGNVILFMVTPDTDYSNIPKEFGLEEKIAELKNIDSTIYKELDKLNLFSITSGTTSDKNKSIEVAFSEYSLAFALHLADGIPKEIMDYIVFHRDTVDINKELNIITLDPTVKSVLFKQFFKKFEILQINIRVKGNKVTGILNVMKQDCSGDNPISKLWYTRCSIKVDLRKIEHKDIEDENVKSKIESLAKVADPDTVFDISQLLLDLSTLQTITPFKIEGLDSDANAAINNLSAEYFSRLDKAGQTMFGYSILPKPENSIKYLFTPNMKNYDVTDNALYFLMNFVDDKEPVIPNLGNNRDFAWKPLLDGTVVADGIMVINATKFIPLIRSKFNPVLQYLVFTKHPFVKAGVYNFEIYWEEESVPGEQCLVVDQDKPWISNWSFEREYRQDYQLVWAPPAPFPVASGKINSKYKASCTSGMGTLTIDNITYPSYDFIVNIIGEMDFGYNSQSNEGRYYDHTITYKVGIKVNADGNLVLLKEVNDTDNHPAGIDIHAWGKFCTFGTLDSTVNAITKSLEKRIEELKKYSVVEFTHDIDTFTEWFMPGSRTFTYKNEGISNYGDFYNYVNYVQE